MARLMQGVFLSTKEEYARIGMLYLPINELFRGGLSMVILRAMVGFAILVLGRQLFWVFVAGIGFILGAFYGAQFYQGPPQYLLLIAIVIGILGALVAYYLQRAAAGLAGFLAGWYLVAVLIDVLGLKFGDFTNILPAVGGIIGALLIASMFDWSLILLSSLSGATIIAQSIQLRPQISYILFFMLLILGVAVQGILFSQEEYPKT
jgi:hypothetical protein